MSLGPAKVRVEIFREPGFFDDNFAKGWTKTSVGTSAFSTDGDVATVNKGDQATGVIEKTFADLLSATYTKLQVRTISVSGSYSVQGWDGSAWFDIIVSAVTAGLNEASIPTGKTMTKIRLIVGGTNGITEFDYVAICKKALLVPDLGDLVEELTVVRPLLNDGICGAKLSIPNFAGG